MQRFSVFTIISGTGWLIDLGLTIGLVMAGLGPFLASMIGSLTAVSFVFVVSQLIVFDTGGRVRTDQYGFYLTWHAMTIPLASGAVAVLAGWFEAPLAQLLDWVNGWLLQSILGWMPDALALAAGVAKAAITPITLTANFFFMRWLVEWRGA